MKTFTHNFTKVSINEIKLINKAFIGTDSIFVGFYTKNNQKQRYVQEANLLQLISTDIVMFYANKTSRFIMLGLEAEKLVQLSL